MKPAAPEDGTAGPSQLTLPGVEVPLSARMPAPGTLPAKALAKLAAGHVLDHPSFERSTKSWRLGAVIHVLRDLGWPVQTAHPSAPTDSCPARTIAMYELPTAWRDLARKGG